MIRACLQSVVQCGLEGIRVERLYTTLSHDDVWGHNFTEGFYQEKVWKYLLNSEHIIVFSAKEDFVRDKKLLEKPQHIVEDVANGLRGYCRGYEKRKDVTAKVSRSYSEAKSQYPLLYIVARQGLREDCFAKDTNVMLGSDINTAQYAMYENLKSVGFFGTNMKELTEAFNAKHSAITFYGEFLESMCAFKVLFIAKSKIGKYDPYLLRCQYIWHKDHHGTIEVMVEVMNKLLKLVEVGESLGETELRLVFDKAIVDSDLVESKHDMLELLKRFLVKLGVVEGLEGGVMKVKFTALFELEYKDMSDESTEEVVIADYREALVRGEPLLYQVYRMIDRKGKEGVPCHLIAANLGISTLLARCAVKNLISERLIVKEQVTSAKTNMFVYVSLKFSTSSKDKGHLSQDSDVKHIPSTLRRLELTLAIFDKEKYLTRVELVRLLKIENSKIAGMPDLDSKTVTRMLTTLNTKGSIMKLTVTGSVKHVDGSNGTHSIDMYHLPNIDKEELTSKVEYLRAKIDNTPLNSQASNKATHCYIGSIESNLPQLIPSEAEGGEYESDGMYLGPRAAFLRQTYFILNALIRPLPVPDKIHEHYAEFGDWWQYVITLPCVEPLECGGYELVKLINRFPIHFFIQCFFRNKKIRGVASIMEHSKYRYYCIGQLPKQSLASLSHYITHGVAGLAKICEILEMMSLLEFTLVPDYTKKSAMGFRIKLRDQTLLLNTINAPVKPTTFKGYNISKMNPKDLMIVQPLCTFDDLVTYWEVAKNICFKSRVLNKRSFNNDSYVPKGLEEVLELAGIAFDQAQEVYNSPGTVERLGGVKSHLGPAGFNLALMLHNRASWVLKVDMERREKFGILVSSLRANVQGLVGRQKKKRRECSGSEEEDSQEEQSRGREEYAEPPVKKMRLAKKIKTKIVNRAHHNKTLHNKKRRTKSYDACDEKTRAMKTRERVQFTTAEDDVIMHCYICNLVLDKKSQDFSQTRDMLHKKLPKDSCDKTKDSCRRRLTVLLSKADFKRKAMHLQSKLHMYMHINLPHAKEIEDLMEVIEDSSKTTLALRIALPTTRAEFETMFKQIIPDQDSSQTVLSLFLPLSYRIKRVQKMPSKAVDCLWSRPDIPLIEQLVYQLIQVTVSAEREYQGQYTQEVSFKLFQEVKKATVDQVYQYMLDKMLIKRYKKRKEVGGAVTSERVVFSSTMTQCFYNPFPNSLISDIDMRQTFQQSCSLYQFKYSAISSSTVVQAMDLMMRDRVRTVLQAAVHPYISPEEESQLLSNAAQEAIIFAKYLKKDKMFVAGVESKEQGAKLGLQVTNGQIYGVMPHNIQPNTTTLTTTATEEKSDIVGYEELIGYNESYKVLPLKISFDVTDLRHSFWRTVDLETGLLTREEAKEAPTQPTELTSNQLRLQSSHALNLFNGEQSQVALLEHYCKELLGIEGAGTQLLETVFQGKEKGVLLSSLTHDVRVLQLALDMDLVVYGGLQEVVVIAKHYAKQWHIALDSAHPNPIIQEEEGAENKIMEDQFEKMFPLTLRPWRLINGDFNIELVKKLVNSIMLLIYSYPGISKKTIDNNYHTFLNRNAVTEILNCMIAGEVLEQCFDRPSAPTLFSDTTPQIRFSSELNDRSCFRVTHDAFFNVKQFI